jgi:hypothetical protein
MTLIAFEDATQALFEAQERADKNGRGYVIPARDAVVKWCKKKRRSMKARTFIFIIPRSVASQANARRAGSSACRTQLYEERETHSNGRSRPDESCPEWQR